MALLSRPRTDEREESSEGGLLRSAGNGAVGGALATVVMTAYRMPVASSLPPTAEFWAQYVAGGEADDHPVPALVLHLGYGATAGVAFGALFGPFERRTDSDEARETGGVVLGTLYALALSLFGERVVLRGLLDVDLDATESLIFHVGHLVYGLSLGSWVASESTVEDLELQ
ncbi:DUF6789 family protein [Halobacterium wangiae]|uniref:DUF6789 family protein n=1 Tax=Halobacterium wangiae TaxID=2902623 RepID=UPI001E61A1CE|nr:DUF6789 family protein [Halobacterium wangiae]